MPSEGWDMTNFGLFSGDDDLGGAVARRLYEKVSELRGKKLVMSECGHGYRSTRCEGQNWGGLDVPFPMESSVFTMLQNVQGGGAMSLSEYPPLRLISGKVKAEQLKETGAKVVVTSCHNCADGLSDVIRH